MENDYESEISKYVDNPQLLIDLIDLVFETFINSSYQSDIEQKRIQLIEVSKSIEQLSKVSVSIPDELRKLKLELIKEIEVGGENNGKIKLLVDGINQIYGKYASQIIHTESNQKRTRNRKSRSGIPQTKQDDFREEIINALRKMGGGGRKLKVQELIEISMKDKFLPGDMNQRETGEIIWKNNVDWERYKLVKEGVLKQDSPNGIWELNEGYL